MSELLIESLSARYGGVALLSRGYGRKSRGYIEVQCNDDYKRVGDEPLQMKQNFPEAIVVVCEDRAKGIERIAEEHPEVKLIIMDDGFQHRYVTPWLNIITLDATRPICDDMMLPTGSLRDTTRRLKMADIFVVTKCKDIAAMQRALKNIDVTEEQSLFATNIENLEPQPLFADEAERLNTRERDDVIALAGIGNPQPFLEMIKSNESGYNLCAEMIYADHHSYTKSDILAMVKMLEQYPTARILTTEKDSVKLKLIGDIPEIIRRRAYFSPIKMRFIKGDEKELISEVTSRLKAD